MNSSLSINQTNDSLMDDLSIFIIKAVYPWNAVQVCVSSLQFITSALMLGAILSTASLRQNQTFIILAHVALNDAILGIGDLVTSSMKVHDYHVGLPHTGTVRSCMYKDYPRLICYTNSNGFLFLLAFNRLVSVACPLWYQQETARRMFTVLMGLIYVRTAPHMVLLGLAITDEKVPFCGYLPTKGWAVRLLSLVVILWSLSVIVIYSATVSMTYARLAKVRKQFGNMDHAREQLQVHVVWTLALILIIHVTTTALGSTLWVIAGNVHAANDVEINYQAFILSKTLISLSSVLYFPVLYKRCTDFRMAFQKAAAYVKGKHSAIGPLMLL